MIVSTLAQVVRYLYIWVVIKCFPLVLHSLSTLTLLVRIIISQWFLNLLPNQALAVKLTAKAWVGRRYTNH